MIDRCWPRKAGLQESTRCQALFVPNARYVVKNIQHVAAVIEADTSDGCAKSPECQLFRK